MCLFSAQKLEAMLPPPANKPRIDKDTTLPPKKQVVDEDTKANVSYGQGEKKGTKSTGRGTDQLKINLNTGTTGSTTGGANV